MARSFTKGFLRERLLALLASRGPSGPAELRRELEISQPTFSRLVASLQDQVLSFGHTRSRRYAIARQIAGVQQPVAVYEVRPHGERLVRFGELSAVKDRGFCLVSSEGAQFFDDLPWFLHNARPAGFLGRLAPRRHPELGLPEDIRLWSADQVLRFAARYGWDPPGAFIVGDDACSLYLREIEHPSNLIDSAKRPKRYPAVVSDLVAFGNAGSSATGEQPKFLATRRDGDRLTPVLVKYSPATDESVGRRAADLLVAEQTALETLGSNGYKIPATFILSAGGRTFLEIERYDREGIQHRIGHVSLGVLDAEFAGTDMVSWADSVRVLAAKGVVPIDTLLKVRWLETFGRLIGNTDMHFGNLSFLMDGVRVTALTPVYDMLPMHYHPRAGEVVFADYELPAIGPELADVAGPALAASIDFWGRLEGDSRVSESFRGVAAQNIRRLRDLRPRVDSLPTASP